MQRQLQRDHSPDNVTFPDGLQHSSTALGMLGLTHSIAKHTRTTVTVSGGGRNATVHDPKP